MKTKYLFIYLIVGIAFLAVSAWVFFTHNKNAKAIRTKYRLGGILLTCTAMLSFASCQDSKPPFVTCYEPVAPNWVWVDGKDYNGECLYVNAGDLIIIHFENSFYKEFIVKIVADNEEQTLLQSKAFAAPEDSNNFQYDLTIDEIEYKGPAQLQIFAISTNSDGQAEEISLGYSYVMNIL